MRASVGRLAIQHQPLAVGAGENVLRLLPPVVITEADIEEAVGKIADALTAIDKETAAA